MRQGFQGSLRIPGDKSISHRSLMFAALAPGQSQVKGLLPSADVFSTKGCLQAMGVEIACLDETEGLYEVTGKRPWQEPSDVLDCGNSGTTIRLMMGLLAGQGIYCVLNGDASLRKRPMSRVITPLRQQGAELYGRDQDRLAPITIRPNASGLKGIRYELPMASAQVKSAVLLAGLFAEEPTEVVEPLACRDHTERMLQAMGAQLSRNDSGLIHLEGMQSKTLQPTDFVVPSDPSSAAFPVVAALLSPNSEVRLEQVGLNPTRTGLFEALKTVGASIQIENEQTVGGEPVGDLIVKTSELKGNLSITAEQIPAMVDEIPILAVAAVFLDGTLTVHGAEELRKKESDRLLAVQQEFAKLGIEVELFEDGLRLAGNPDRCLPEPSEALDSWHDHRIAMALSVLNWANRFRNPSSNQSDWDILGKDCVSVSYPRFFEDFNRLTSTVPA